MKPEDILDGLGEISEQMVLDAQNLKKSPRNSLKWGSIAACILCGVLLLGICAVKLRNQDGQQSQKLPEPSPVPTPAVSELPQDSSAESQEIIQPTESKQNQTYISNYQVVVREDAVYFVDPYIGLMSMEPETQTIKTILPNGECSLAETEGNLYCLGQASRQVNLVENGNITTLVTLEDVGPGTPNLLGVSGGYACWEQDGTVYAASLENGIARKLLTTSVETGGYLSCGVYQGTLYYVGAVDGRLYRMALDSGAPEEIVLTDQLAESDSTLKLYCSGTTETAKLDGDRLYIEGTWDDGETVQDAYFCCNLSDGSVQELPVDPNYRTTMTVQNGTLYFLFCDLPEADDEAVSYRSYDVETGEKTELLNKAQTASMGYVSHWQAGENGIYYTRLNDADEEQQQVDGLYYYDLSTGANTQVYRSSGIYGSLTMQSNSHFSQGDFYDLGAWMEDSEVYNCYDLTRTENGMYYVDPASGVYRYIPEEERTEQLVSGIACRILKCDEGLYATCSDSGEVYEIKDGTAQLLLTLEKEQQVAVKPVAVKNGTLYWNYFVTDLTTGETETDALFRLKQSQPQILHDGKIYCLGENGEIGYVDPTGGTESYQPLTDALGTNANDWSVKFFDDCIIAMQRTMDGNGFDVYQMAYEGSSMERFGSVEGETIRLLNLEGNTLYLEWLQENVPTAVLAMNISTGEIETVLGEQECLNFYYETEVQVWGGICYSVMRDVEAGNITELSAYDLETGINTTYVPGDSMVSE